MFEMLSKSCRKLFASADQQRNRNITISEGCSARETLKIGELLHLTGNGEVECDTADIKHLASMDAYNYRAILRRRKRRGRVRRRSAELLSKATDSVM